MAQILVRGLEQTIVDRLKKRAKRDGRSLQSEVKLILEQAAQIDMDSALKLAESIRRKFKGRKFSDSSGLIREDRDR